MSLVEFRKDKYIDTDDLAQPEYYYYRKALGLANSLSLSSNILEYNHQMNHYVAVARMILRGYLSAHEIETDPNYEWLRDEYCRFE